MVYITQDGGQRVVARSQGLMPVAVSESGRSVAVQLRPPLTASARRLDKDTAWEDDAHFLTLAQSGEGKAAIVRCDLTGACERASSLWDVPVPSESSVFYAKPPVVLATP